MRLINIKVYPRLNTDDNEYTFNSNDNLSYISKRVATNTNDVSDVYQFVSMNLNYSLLSSNILSTLILSMQEPIDKNNSLKSGQPIEIRDNGEIVFQGNILSLLYRVEPINERGQGGMYVLLTLSPSIYQLTLMPMIFNNDQVNQINSLLGIQAISFLQGNVSQKVTSADLLSYMLTNTDYNTYFSGLFNNKDLPSSVYLTATSGQSRDSVLRTSIDFSNCVFYQQENGTWNINQLDSTNKAPFALDLWNDLNNTIINDNKLIIAPMLNYDYIDNAASTPSIISNYAMIPSNLGVSLKPNDLLLSYKPNPQYFPRLQQLQTTGWFTGILSNTQINTNIMSDPTIRETLEGFQSYPDQFMINSNPFGAKEDWVSSYQALLTAKQLARSLTGYASLECNISLDDPNLPGEGMGNILGKCVNILNCDLDSGLIATYSRSYSTPGTIISLNIVPLGSCTGYWKN